MAQIKVKYVDHRPMYFPRLFHYPGGLTVPNDRQEIKLTDKEWKHLKTEKNGDKFCYQEVKPKRKKPVEIKMEDSDGSR